MSYRLARLTELSQGRQSKTGVQIEFAFWEHSNQSERHPTLRPNNIDHSHEWSNTYHFHKDRTPSNKFKQEALLMDRHSLP
mmetsp:Transcript_51878/g.77450  ORF Transcript_51878/g.77450 Transcript_51878/m.77450 type:complete len:81 (+) Transcript_51878:1182-1424(+)